MDDILAKKNRHLFLEEKDNVGNSFIANVNNIVDDLDNIDAVANDLERIDTVADNIDNVNTVAENIDDINTTVENLSKIDQFNDNLVGLLESLLEQLGEDGNAWLVRLTELGESILATTSAFNYAVTTTLTQNIASGATLTLPNAMKYRVGTHMLMVSWNGTVCYIGDQYNEVGSFGQWSTTITMNVPLKTGDKIQFRVVALADAAAFVDQIDGIIGNASVTATGSTETRTLADRFGDIINVKDYGAKGNGETDDTVSIQAALTAAATGRGNSVYFPEGIYVITDTLELPTLTDAKNSNLLIYGEGFGSIISVSSDIDAIFKIQGSNVKISDMYLLCPESSFSCDYGILISPETQDLDRHFIINNCRIEGFKHGIYSEKYSDNWRIENCYIINCSLTGICTVDWGLNSCISGNFIYMMVEDAIGIYITKTNQHAEGIRILNNTVISTAGYDLKIDAGYAFYIANNIFDQVGKGNIIDGTTNPLANMNFVNNWFGPKTSASITNVVSITGTVVECSFSDNRFVAKDATCLYLDSGCTGITLTGNSFRVSLSDGSNFTGPAVRINQSNHIFGFGNNFNLGTGVVSVAETDDTSTCVFIGNYFMNTPNPRSARSYYQNNYGYSAGARGWTKTADDVALFDGAGNPCVNISGPATGEYGYIVSTPTTRGFCGIVFDVGTPTASIKLATNEIYRFTGGGFYPISDNTRSLGYPTNDRYWSTVYARTGTISTSDRRLKTSINDFPDEVLAAWGEVEFVQYQLVESVNKKGSESARIHSGMIAQKIDEIFKNHGLDASRYGLFCYDEWEAEEAKYDENGKEISPGYPAGNRYSLRYEEALCLEAAYQRWIGKQRDAKIEALMQRISALENNQ